MKKIISFGEALIDMLSSRISSDKPAGQLTSTTESFTKFPGGAPANVAAAVGKLGGRSYFAGKVGADMFGDFLKASLQEMQVHTDYLMQTREAKTALAFVSLDSTGERSFEFYRNPSADLFFAPTDFRDTWFSEPGIFHFCSNTLTDSDILNATQAGLEKAREAGFIISFDMNLRQNLWPDHRDPYAFVWACIKQAHIVKLSLEEMSFLCRDEHETQVLRKLREAGAALIIVTDGSSDIRYYTARDEGSIKPPSVRMVDSTAAGDAFVGGLLYRLSALDIAVEDLNDVLGDIGQLEDILAFACACGAHAVTHGGAFTSLPGPEDVKNYR